MEKNCNNNSSILNKFISSSSTNFMSSMLSSALLSSKYQKHNFLNRISEQESFVECNNENEPPQRRESEPIIQCSYLNYGFEISNFINTSKKFSSLEQINKIIENTNKEKPMKTKIKIILNDVNNEETLINSPCETNSNSSTPISKANQDSFDNDNESQDIYENVKFCKKCGHNSLINFTTK